jgi:phosphomannomutase
MRQAVDSPPTSLSGLSVSSVRDLRHPEATEPSWRGAALLVEIRLADGGRVFVRPSGTEPKLKIYVDLRAELESGAPLSAAEDETKLKALDVARALVTSLGLDNP